MVAFDGENEGEDDISTRFWSGHPEALAEAYQRWGPLVHTLALRSLANHHDAEDVTQAVFVSAWRGRHTLRPGPEAMPRWLVGIARHRIADHQTQRYRNWREVSALSSVKPDGGHHHVIDRAVEERIVVRDAVDGLGEPRGSIVRLALMEGRTHQEVADLLTLPLGTVKSHVRRGLIQLRHRLEEVTP